MSAFGGIAGLLSRQRRAILGGLLDPTTPEGPRSSSVRRGAIPLANRPTSPSPSPQFARGRVAAGAGPPVPTNLAQLQAFRNFAANRERRRRPALGIALGNVTDADLGSGDPTQLIQSFIQAGLPIPAFPLGFSFDPSLLRGIGRPGPGPSRGPGGSSTFGLAQAGSATPTPGGARAAAGAPPPNSLANVPQPPRIGGAATTAALLRLGQPPVDTRRGAGAA